MPRGYRYVFAALVGWVILCGANQQSEHNQRSGGTNNTASSPAPSPAYSPYPNRDSEACYKAKDHDQADLCAQWRAAIAAEKAAHEARRSSTWSIVATGLSAFSLAAVALALYLTVESNNISRDTARKELRAYVSIEGCALADGSKFARASPEYGRPGAMVIVRNTGTTPARNVVHWGEIVLGPIDGQESLSAPSPFPTTYATSVGAGAIIQKPLYLGRKLTRKEIREIRTGAISFFVHGFIAYKDIYGSPHTSSYRMNFTGLWPLIGPGADMMFCENGNQAN